MDKLMAGEDLSGEHTIRVHRSDSSNKKLADKAVVNGTN